MPAGKCPETGKTQYVDRREARLALDKLIVRRAGHKTEQSSYKCPACALWHITSMGDKPHHNLRQRRLAPAKRWRWKQHPPTTEE